MLQHLRIGERTVVHLRSAIMLAAPELRMFEVPCPQIHKLPVGLLQQHVKPPFAHLRTLRAKFPHDLQLVGRVAPKRHPSVNQRAAAGASLVNGPHHAIQILLRTPVSRHRSRMSTPQDHVRSGLKHAVDDSLRPGGILDVEDVRIVATVNKGDLLKRPTAETGADRDSKGDKMLQHVTRLLP